MNLKHQFYRAYYQNFDPCWFDDDARNQKVLKKNEDNFKAVNNRICKKLEQDLTQWLFNKSQFGSQLHQFQLQTVYPGLIIGTGYTHETGNIGEYKIGFHFDHTSGLPILPGHSVKGALRAVFPRAGKKLNSKEDKAIKEAKAEYILHLLENRVKPKVLFPDKKEERYSCIHKLEEQIFDGAAYNSKAKKKEEPQYPMDVFLDAQISNTDKNGKILGDDAITPHEKEVWKNPKPLPFLKVLPGVKWQFSFLLNEAVINNTGETETKNVRVTAHQKEQLFKAILEDQGIGAKTNVGYGRFEYNRERPPVSDSKSKKKEVYSPDLGGKGISKKPPTTWMYYKGTLKHSRRLHPVDGEILQTDKKVLVKIFLKQDNCPVFELPQRISRIVKKGDLVKLEVMLKKDLSVNQANFKGKKN